MKVSAVFAYSAVAMVAVHAESFYEEDQAIWIDRHNYIRSAALPWSASNMRRIGWDVDLATKAASTASTCSATTARGVNVYQSSSNNISFIVDEAFQQWVVETAISTIKMLPQPGSSGLDVGQGIYNSYSQFVWALTTSVGCATASCSGGEMVVCEYSPPGNDGKSAWYKHGAQGSACPDGTVESHGLCIDVSDDANNQIAPIPKGKWTYQVYPAFVATIHTTLLNSARAIANGWNAQLTSLSSGRSTSDSLSEQETSKKSTTTPSESSFADVVTQEDVKQALGKVKPSDIGSSFSSEAKTRKAPTRPEDDVQSAINESELEHVETGHSEEASEGVTTAGIFGMYMLGVASVAGIMVFVHFKKRQHNAIPAK